MALEALVANARPVAAAAGRARSAPPTWDPAKRLRSKDDGCAIVSRHSVRCGSRLARCVAPFPDSLCALECHGSEKAKKL